MKKRTMSVNLILSSALLILGVATVSAQQAAPVIKKVPVQNTTSVAGKDLYREYCAVCHGISGKGDGPAASALKSPPADLTLIARKNGGKFSEVQVQHIINGDADQLPAHGSKDMPIWGNLFRHMGANSDLGTVRVYNLTKYLEQIQAK